MEILVSNIRIQIKHQIITQKKLRGQTILGKEKNAVEEILNFVFLLL